MTAIVTGQGLGLLNTSLGLLGGQGQLGAAGQGAAGDKVAVNAATGNLVVQQQDEWLVGVGPDVALTRTYNSLGAGTDDNGDNWRLGLSRLLKGLTGTVNTTGSTITRVADDGSETVYTYSGGKYVSKAGGGSFDTLSYSAGVWTWTDGDTQTKEAYEAVQNTTDLRLKTITDLDGNKVALTYLNNTSYLITEIATSSASTASNEKVVITYDGTAGKTSNILSMTTTYKDAQNATQSLTRVSYTYEPYNGSFSRLKTVTVDLKPVTTGAATTHVTTYAYTDTTNKRLASISQSDGNQVSFEYDASGRIKNFTQTGAGQTQTTSLVYDTVNGKTTVTDPLGLVTELSYSVPAGQNQYQLTQVKGPAVGGTSQITKFDYDINGNVWHATDARDNTTTYKYDVNGNRTYERDAAGKVVERSYNSSTNLLELETTYTVADPDGDLAGLPGGAQTTRYVYNNTGHLRFVVSPQKRVTEYKYNTLGQQTSATQYGAATLGAEAITESALSIWAGAQDLTRTQRTDYTYNTRSQLSKSTTYGNISSTGVGSTPSDTQYVYDQAGNLLTRIDGMNHATNYAYDGLNRVVRETDALSQQRLTVYRESAQGQVVTTIEANGGATISTYDALGRLTSVQRASNVTTATNAVGTSHGTTSYTYDKLNRLRMVSTPSGEKTFYLYDEASRKVGEIDPTGALTQYIYNADNQVVQTTQWSNKVSASTLTALALDPSSGALPANLASNNFTGWTRTVDGAATNFTNGSNLNQAWTLSGETTLWLRQVGTEAISSSLSSANLSVTAGKTYEVSAYTSVHRATASLEVAFYNSQGLQIGASVVPTGGVPTNAAENPDWGSALADYKRLWGKVTAPAGAISARLVVRKGPTNADRADSYLFLAHPYLGEANGPQTLVSGFDVRPAADAANDRVNRSIYDKAGRLVKTIDAVGAVVKYTYDGAGQLTETLRYATVLTAQQLQAVQTAASEVLADNANTIPASSGNDRYENRYYNADGLLEGVLDGAGAYTENSYDAAGRLLKTTQYAQVAVDNSGTLNRSVKPLVLTQAPTNGTFVGRSPASDQTTQYIHDASGQLVGIVDAENYYTRYTYNLGGLQLASRRFATKVQGSFDGSTPPKILQPGAAVPSSGAYIYTYYTLDHLTNNTYDDLNRLIRINVYPEDSITSYVYDATGKLISETKTYLQTNTTQSRYDVLGRLTATLGGEGSQKILDWKLANPSATDQQIATQTELIWAKWGTQYTYDNDDRLLLKTDPDGVGGAGLKTYYYYDAAGRKTVSVNALGEVTQYVYSTFGQIIAQKQVGKRLDSSTLNGLSGGRDTAVATAIANLISATVGTVNAVSTTQWGHDQRGLLASTTDALSNVNTQTYNAFGQLWKSTDKVDASRTVVTTRYYNNAGQRIQVTQSGTGLPTRALEFQDLDAFGRITYGYDFNYQSDERHYDRLGRQVQTVDRMGAVTSTTYDAFDRVLTTTDGLGKATTYEYDDTYLSQTITTPEGIITTTTRNQDGLVTAVTDGRSTTTLYNYNHDGQLTSTSVTGSGAFTPISSSSVAYDQAGRVFETKDARGTITRTTYDAASRVLKRVVDPDGTGLKITSEYRYDAKGQAVWARDANGVWTKSEFNLKGELTATVVDPLNIPNAAGSTADFDTNLVANASGLNLRTEYTYDAQGHTLTVTEGAGTTDAQATQYIYDAAGRRTQTIVDPGVEAGKLNLTTTYTYDKGDNVVAKTDAEGKVTRYVYDANNQLRYTVDPTGAVTYNEYDPNGRLSRTTAYVNRITLGTAALAINAGHITPLLNKDITKDRATRYTYDQDGRLKDTIDALGFVTRRVYDANSQVTKLTRYAKAATSVAETIDYSFSTFTSPAMDESDAGNQVAQTVHDVLGRATWSIDALNYATQRTFDANGNVVQVKRFYNKMTGTLATNGTPAVSTDATRDQTSYTSFDKANRPIWSVDALGYATQRTFDANGNVTQLTRYYNQSTGTLAVNGTPTVGANATFDQTTYTVYDKAGQVTFSIDPENYVTQNVYDQVGNLKSTTRYAKPLVNAYVAGVAPKVLSASPGAVAYSHVLVNADDSTTQITYDKAGRRTDVLEAAGSSEATNTHTVYDKEGRVTEVTAASNSSTDASTTRYTLNDAGQVTEEIRAYGKPEQATTRYVLDAFGQRVKVIDPRGVDAAEGTSAVSIAARADILGGTTAIWATPPSKTTDPTNYQKLLDAFTTAQEFDKLGRLTKTSSVHDLKAVYGAKVEVKTEYDAFGNAVKVTDPNGNAGYFFFDTLNQATWQVDPMGYATQTEFDPFGQARKITKYEKPVQVIGTTAALSTGTKLVAYGTVAAAGSAQIYVLSSNDPTTQIEHDKLGRQTKITDAAGFSESMTYDGLGNKETYTTKSSTNATNGPSGTYTYAYDKNGNVKTETILVGQNVVTAYIYDSRGNVTKKTEALGLSEQRITDYVYDKQNRLISKSQPSMTAVDASAGKATLTSNVKPVESRKYDARGNLTEVSTNGGQRTLYYYDAQNRKTAELIAMEARADGAYGAISIFEYDKAGNVIKQSLFATLIKLPVASGGTLPPLSTDTSVDRITLYTYNASGLLKSQTIKGQISGALNSTSGNFEIGVQDLVINYTYDASGSQTVTEDGRGRQTYTYYDPLGRRVAQIDGEKYISVWTYDSRGNITKESRATNPWPSGQAPTSATGVALPAAVTAGSYGTTRTTEYTYDGMGRIKTQVVKNVRTGVYADSPSIIGDTANDLTTSYEYNGLGSVIQKTEASGDVLNWSFDVKGRETRKRGAAYLDYLGVDTVRKTEDTEYNALGAKLRKIEQDKVIGVIDTNDRITNYFYDDSGRLSQEVDPLGNVIKYQYDLAGHVAARSVSRQDVTGVAYTDTTLYTYNLAGREIQQYTYTKTGVDAPLIQDGTLLMQLGTTYTAFGEVASKLRNGEVIETATYDAAGRLVATAGGAGAPRVYVRDAAGNITMTITPPANEQTAANASAFAAFFKYKAFTAELIRAAIEAGAHANVSVFDGRNLQTDTYELTSPPVITNNSGAIGGGEAGWIQTSTIPVEMTTDILLNTGGVTVNGTLSMSYTYHYKNNWGGGRDDWLDKVTWTLSLSVAGGSSLPGTQYQVVLDISDGFYATNGTGNMGPTRGTAIIDTAGSNSANFVVNQYGSVWQDAGGVTGASYKVSVYKITNPTAPDIGGIEVYRWTGTRSGFSTRDGVSPTWGANADQFFTGQGFLINNTPAATQSIIFKYRADGASLWRQLPITYQNGQALVQSSSLQLPELLATSTKAGFVEFQMTMADGQSAPLEFRSGKIYTSYNTTGQYFTFIDYPIYDTSAQNPAGYFFIGAPLTQGGGATINYIHPVPNRQPGDAKGLSARIKYRIEGQTAWTVVPTVFPAGATADWFVIDPNAVGMNTANSNYEILIEVKGDAAGVGQTLYSAITYMQYKVQTSSSIQVGWATYLERSTRAIHFNYLPLATDHAQVTYTVYLPSGAATGTANLIKAGDGRFYWDTSELAPYGFSDATYSVDYKVFAYDLSGKKLVDGSLGREPIGSPFYSTDQLPPFTATIKSLSSASTKYFSTSGPQVELVVNPFWTETYNQSSPASIQTITVFYRKTGSQQPYSSKTLGIAPGTTSYVSLYDPVTGPLRIQTFTLDLSSELGAGVDSTDFDIYYTYAPNSTWRHELGAPNGPGLQAPLRLHVVHDAVAKTTAGNGTMQLLSVTNRLTSNHNKLVYNAFGEAVQEFDAQAFERIWAQEQKLGRALTAAELDDQATSLSYNNLGLLTSKRTAKAMATLQSGFQTAVKAEQKYVYDKQGRLIAEQDANGGQIGYQLLAAGEGTRIVAKQSYMDGGKTIQGFDVFGDLRRSTVVNDVNAVTDYTYDKMHRITRADKPTGAGGKRATDLYTYDSVGNQIKHQTSPDVSANGSNVFTAGRIYTDTLKYDGLGRVTQARTGIASGVIPVTLTPVTETGLVRTISYDNVGATVHQKTTDENNQVSESWVDAFGRQTKKIDLGLHEVLINYNLAGNMIQQYQVTAGTTTKLVNGQDIAYTYFGNGQVKSITDWGIRTLAQYEYDRNGNKTYEGYSTLDGLTPYQRTSIAYDELNRIVNIADYNYSLTYEYDKVGNRRRVAATKSGNAAAQDYWYDYDSMNRMVVSMGTLSGGRATSDTGENRVSQGTSGNGVRLTYDKANNRRSASYAAGSNDTYTYTADGYLTSVVVTDVNPGNTQRTNDLLGRVAHYTQTNSAGTSNQDYTYLADGRVKKVEALDAEGNRSVTTNSYASLTDSREMSLLQTAETYTRSAQAYEQTNYTRYSYALFDSALQSEIKVGATSPTVDPAWGRWAQGVSRLTYDVNGHAKMVLDSKDASNEDVRTITYVNNAEGQILTRAEYGAYTSSVFQSYYYVNGRLVGESGNQPSSSTVSYSDALKVQQPAGNPADRYRNIKPITSDFDQNYRPINATYPNFTGSTHVVVDGETLESVAAATWGDASLWYLIAEANNLLGNTSKLVAGQTLSIPNKVTNLHNNSQTFKVYNAGEALGDVSPTLPDAPKPPPAKNNCGGVGMILMVVVAVVVSFFTAGAAAAALGPVLAGALGGAVGSIASQLVGLATGTISSFSWSGVAMGAISGGAAAGAGEILGALGATAENMTTVGFAVTKAVVGNVIGQGVAQAVKLQSKFSWTAVAAAGAGAAASVGASSLLGDTLGNDLLGKTGGGLLRGTVSNMAGGWAGAVASHQKPNWAAIAAQSFGSALGDSIVGSIQQADSKRLTDAQIDKYLEGVSGSGNPQAADDGGYFPSRSVQTGQTYSDAYGPVNSFGPTADASGNAFGIYPSDDRGFFPPSAEPEPRAEPVPGTMGPRRDGPDAFSDGIAKSFADDVAARKAAAGTSFLDQRVPLLADAIDLTKAGIERYAPKSTQGVLNFGLDFAVGDGTVGATLLLATGPIAKIARTEVGLVKFGDEVEGVIQRGGAHGEVKGLAGYESHHMPANAVSPLPTNQGPAVALEVTDHRMTASWGSSREAKAYRQTQESLIKSGNFDAAQKMDIEDLREKFGNKYNAAIEQALKYTEKLKSK
ncbi:MAG: hypothetical protein EOP36_11020 [Rubrivivax sp.]|nr:MAG: hypothetical protein EOP36_11020 [Rubrivivax sp.]